MYPLISVKLLLPPKILVSSQPFSHHYIRPWSTGCNSPLSLFPRLADTLDHQHKQRTLKSLQDKIRWVFIGFLHSIQTFWFVQIEGQFLRGLWEKQYSSMKIHLLFLTRTSPADSESLWHHNLDSAFSFQIVPLEEIPSGKARGMKTFLGTIYEVWGLRSLSVFCHSHGSLASRIGAVLMDKTRCSNSQWYGHLRVIAWEVKGGQSGWT